MALFFSRSAKIDGSMVSRPIRVGGDIYPRRDDVDRLVEGGGFLTPDISVLDSRTENLIFFALVASDH